MTNTTLTLALPLELKKELLQYKEINWSEETRTFLKNKLRTLKLTKKVEKLTQNNEYNIKTIDETLQKLLKEGKLNMSDDFSDLYAHSMDSLKEVWDNKSDEVWENYIKKHPNKKKLY
jgi:5'-deoxynucleotidase YfbR-like HD superfamily hydrolase